MSRYTDTFASVKKNTESMRNQLDKYYMQLMAANDELHDILTTCTDKCELARVNQLIAKNEVKMTSINGIKCLLDA